ncbi:MAG: hypothetical protein ONB46_06390 [candidate division KSB1 bacterium]|nr:hypothetical protein [candidate division KSB1 bacterium]MDZ7365331.1 hypothetical protein [candidate division KSB1 bacterium]MDZ7403198.1 hypothetical protein [candidate division KSB1 bacterium]
MHVELTGSTATAVLIFSAFLMVPWLCGVALMSRLNGVFYLGERLLLGLIFGITLAVALTFFASLVAGFHAFVLVIVLTIMIGIAALALSSGQSRRAPREMIIPLIFRNKPTFYLTGHAEKFWPRRMSRTDGYGLLVFLGALVFFTVLARRLILWQHGALATGYLDAWGDLPFHLSLITSFVSSSELALRSTILAGEPLTYPFLSDFFSAMLMRLGVPLEHAVELPAILLNSVTLALLFYLSHRLVRHRGAAAFVPVLFVLAGGLGFLWFLADLYLAPKPIWEFLQQLPRRYTNISELKIHWVNPVLAHLLPQRSFLFGFPLGLSVILLWWNQLRRQKLQPGWITGLITGMLPLFHTHTFLALMMVAAMLAGITFLRRTDWRASLRYWLGFGATAMLVAAPALIYLLSSQVSLANIRFHPKWMAENENLLWFWLKNTSVFIPLLLMALALAKLLRLRRQALLFYLPFGVLFVLCNLFVFSAYAYDTNKILIFWFLLSLPFVARLLVALYQSNSWWLHGLALRLLMVTLIFSGSLNLLHEWQNGGWPELSAEEVALAQELRAQTHPQDIFLTAPIHNNLLTLAGRAVVLGYPGHVISHGLNAAPVEKAIGEIYSGGTEAEQHLRSYQVDYIVVGPQERQRFGEKVNWLEQRFPVFTRSENYIIYQINARQDFTASEPSILHATF